MKYSVPSNAKCPPVKGGIILFAIILPLFRTLIIYTLKSISEANGAPDFIVSLLSFLGEAISVAGYFGAATCMITAQWYSDRSKTFFALIVHVIALLVIGLGIQNLILFLLAVIDDMTLVNFYFGNYTVSQLINDGLLSRSVISGAINILILIAIILEIAAMNKKIIKTANEKTYVKDYYAKIKESAFVLAILFLIVSCVIAIFETVMTIIQYGTPNTISDVLYLAKPYFIALITVLIGWVTALLTAKHYTEQK